MSYGFGIIGTGMIAAFHAKAIHSLNGGHFVGAFSRSFDRAQEFCEQNGGKVYQTLDDMLADPEIHIVTICTPSAMHGEAALAAIAAGKHVLIEKPMEVTAARCDEIIDAAEKAGVVAASIFQNRFIEASQILKSTIDSGRFGKVVLGDAYVKWFRSQEYYDKRKASGTLAMDGGGALMNQAIHAIDLLQWCMGPVEAVTAYTETLGHDGIDEEDVAVAILKFASGARGVIEGTTAAYPGMLKKLEISGTNGTVVLEEDKFLKWEFSEATTEDATILEEHGSATVAKGGASDPSAIDFRLHEAQFQNLIDHLSKDVPLIIDSYEGRKAVAIIEAIYQSAKERKEIKL
ncbi:Gfo/Idh/MocA family oxidoreductase [Rhodobacteraceae bacterium RKSG542]|uniref:Gfo/Idh/MocA family protein n=1 Tax=Pseudovibrio flavus TaxID=2529854 RepID=UPI0012BBBB77|nr:Gfo/Idh/MocA family oxidoreductase [Pseudovibrio flavus]MTI15743.1 Gfo/Idh/MocA family oxidoreductase [Pseudovibrio flavus]